ncbi:hypothetical protein BCON_0337g00060 [Botryotinia convoluta]|uniref:Uncharacterized protein n=1 Tax=Botryotinia convoluta TaxID=54673 RepID=A0A4Z1HMR3_9HELO|nr:hypothetical protein BCON_0337g00060 [Botryotinia convoluta]
MSDKIPLNPLYNPPSILSSTSSVEETESLCICSAIPNYLKPFVSTCPLTSRLSPLASHPHASHHYHHPSFNL